MKFVQKWGMAFWLVVLLCVPWSTAEAGRPVYLSDYLDFDRSITSQWYLTLNSVNPWEVDNWGKPCQAIRITLASDGVSFNYTYHRGQITYDNNLNETIYDFSDSLEFGVEKPLFSYTVDSNGLVTFTNVLDNPIADSVSLSDRQPTDKMIKLNSNYHIQLDLPRLPYANHNCLQINFIAGWSGDRKNIPPSLCELYTSEDIFTDPGIMACTLEGQFYECVDSI
jgi:hypothetical protein